VLVLDEIRDTYEVLAADRIPLDKSRLLEIFQEQFRVNIFITEDLILDPGRTVFQLPVGVGNRPQTNKQQPRMRAQRSQLFIIKE
jgi:hypothetical protein